MPIDERVTTRERRRGAGNEGGEKAIASDASSNAACALFPAAQLATQPTRKTNTAGSHAFATPSFSSARAAGVVAAVLPAPQRRSAGQARQREGSLPHVLLPVRAERRAALGRGWAGGTGDQPARADRSARERHRGQARLRTRGRRLVAQLPKITVMLELKVKRLTPKARTCPPTRTSPAPTRSARTCSAAAGARTAPSRSPPCPFVPPRGSPPPRKRWRMSPPSRARGTR